MMPLVFHPFVAIPVATMFTVRTSTASRMGNVAPAPASTVWYASWAVWVATLGNRVSQRLHRWYHHRDRRDPPDTRREYSGENSCPFHVIRHVLTRPFGV